jgi:hypothetical protein
MVPKEYMLFVEANGNTEDISLSFRGTSSLCQYPVVILLSIKLLTVIIKITFLLM